MKTEERSGAAGLVSRGIGLIKTHPKISSLAAFAGAGLLVFAVVWFQPHKLFIEKTVNEPLPGGPPAAQQTNTPAAPAGPVAVAVGSFRSLEHKTTGTASVLRLADGSNILRFDDLDTSNGPDLRVYLSKVPAGPDWHAYGGTGTYVELGALKGNRGDQNYQIPAGTDLTMFHSAVIWCVRFRVGFGVAPLNTA